ncbi:hypothetical protein AAC387_Pa07g3654 [Persea americana]
MQKMKEDVESGLVGDEAERERVLKQGLEEDLESGLVRDEAARERMLKQEMEEDEMYRLYLEEAGKRCWMDIFMGVFYFFVLFMLDKFLSYVMP